MTEDNWKTLRVPPEAYETAKEQKEENNLTWGQQLVCDNPTTTDVEISLSDEDIQHIINEIAATADGEGRVDSDSLAREVASQLDYSMLATKVADELEGRMR